MAGFQSPNYTQTPNDLFDALLPELGLAELKVVLCVIRHTFGYHTEEAKLSIRAIARFTGLTAKSVVEGAEKAEAHGLIERYQDGKKTTMWKAIVTVIPSSTRRITKYHSTVLPATTQVGVKESKENNKEKPKGDLVDLELAKLAKTQGQNEALTAFERDLQLPASWTWYPAKSSEEKEWASLREFVEKTYQQDPAAFAKYQTWRTQPYARGAMSNRAIKISPADFPLSFSDFLASSAMYGGKQQETKASYQEYQPEDESEFVPAPERKR